MKQARSLDHGVHPNVPLASVLLPRRLCFGLLMALLVMSGLARITSAQEAPAALDRAARVLFIGE